MKAKKWHLLLACSIVFCGFYTAKVIAQSVPDNQTPPWINKAKFRLQYQCSVCGFIPGPNHKAVKPKCDVKLVLEENRYCSAPECKQGPLTANFCGVHGKRPKSAFENLYAEIEDLKRQIKKVGKSPGKGGAPLGSVTAFAGPRSRIPEGWLLCDGRNLKKDKYKQLHKVIGTIYGGGLNSTTFALPDYRGYFLRGMEIDPKLNRDVDRLNRKKPNSGHNSKSVCGPIIGSVQEDSVGPHKHSYQVPNPLASASTTGSDARSWFSRTERSSTLTGSWKGSETRSKNVYVHWIIKVVD